MAALYGTRLAPFTCMRRAIVILVLLIATACGGAAQVTAPSAARYDLQSINGQSLPVGTRVITSTSGAAQ